MSEQLLEFVDARQFQRIARAGGRPDNVGIMKACGVMKSVDRERRTIDFVLSDASIDRESDSISVEGWELADYRRNPVVLWAHDHHEPPVARALEVSVSAGRLRARDEFTPADLNPFGDMIFRLYVDGFLSAVSVGFQPHEWSYPKDREFGVNFTRQTLLEHSAVPVPAAPGALIEARAKGIDLRPLTLWAETTLDGLHAGGTVRRAPVERLWAQSNERTLVSLAGLDVPQRPATAKRDDLASVIRSLRTFRTKAGRVLSRSNEEHLREAQRRLSIVLTQLDADSDDASRATPKHALLLDNDEVDVSVSDVERLIDAAVAERIMQLTGRVS